MSCSLVSAHASVDRAWRFTQTESDPASRTIAAIVSSAQGSQRRKPRATDDVLSKSSANAAWPPFESSADYPGSDSERISVGTFPRRLRRPAVARAESPGIG